MKQLSKVLIAMDLRVREDPGTIQRSLVRGMALADLTGCALELLVVVHDHAFDHPLFRGRTAVEEARRHHVQEQFEWADDIARRLQRNGYRASAAARWDEDEADALVRHVLESPAELVIKHPEQHKFKLGLFSNADWDLLRRCPVPLLFSRAGGLERGSTVLVAVDPTHGSEGDRASLDVALVDAARFFADLVDGRLEVVHAYELPRNTPAFDGYVPYFPETALAAPGTTWSRELTATGMEERTAIEKRHGELLQRFAETTGVPLERVKLARGPAHEVIAREAESLRAGLVVMGALRRTRLDRVMLGVDAEPVLAETTCDVLFLKPPGFATDVEPHPAGLSEAYVVRSEVPRA